MTQIRQDDLLNSNFSVTTRTFNLLQISVTTGATIPANIFNAPQGELFSENKTGQFQYPLWIKTNGTGAQGWTREADWQIHNQTVTTTTVLFYNAGANATVTPTAANITISVGTPLAIYGAAAWSVGPNLTQSVAGSAGCGSQNAGLIAGSILAAQNTSELFNGSSWSLSGNLTQSRNFPEAMGSQNAGLVNGSDTASAKITELFNGSAWSLSANTTQSRDGSAGAGSQNAGMVIGGGPAATSTTELFNGSSWTTGANISTNRQSFSGLGSQNAALITGGSGSTTTVEIFNGSAWSLSGAVITSRSLFGASGTQNAGLIAGNSGAPQNTSELFNGSSWSSSGNLTQSRNASAGAGSQNAGLLAGSNAGAANTSELHNQTVYRPVNYQNYKCAKNIGIVAQNPGGATATTISLAFSGYINNVSISTNNSSLTTVAQVVNTFVCLTPNSSTTQINVSITAGNAATASDGFTNKSITTVTNTDIVLGLNLSQTELVLLGNTLSNLSPWVRW